MIYTKDNRLSTHKIKLAFQNKSQIKSNTDRDREAASANIDGVLRWYLLLQGSKATNGAAPGPRPPAPCGDSRLAVTEILDPLLQGKLQLAVRNLLSKLYYACSRYGAGCTGSNVYNRLSLCQANFLPSFFYLSIFLSFNPASASAAGFAFPLLTKK